MPKTTSILTFTDGNFEAEVLKSPIPAVVDFWAPWCGPCRGVAPILEKLAQEFTGKVRFGKLDVDRNENTTLAHRIRSIPTLLVFHHSKVAHRIVGAEPNLGRTLARKLQELLETP